jgi:hypothetical protein
MKTNIFNNSSREESTSPSADGYQWITCSLFAPMTVWPVLLAKLQHLLEELKNEYLYFQVRLNDDNGANIRIALLAKVKNKQKIGDALNLRFKPLLSGISTNAMTRKVDSIFLPYPTNVIEFDLYNLHYDEKLSGIYEEQQEISDLIIEVLKQGDVDLETIITFCFYLQICLINVLLRYPISDAGLIKLLSNHVPKDVSSVKTASDENIEILAGITSDIMCAEVYEDELSWINRWMAFCEESIEKYLDLYDKDTGVTESILKSFYQSFVFRIHESLGLSEKSKIFLNYTVHYSISGFMEGKQSLTKRNQMTSKTTSGNYDIQKV